MRRDRFAERVHSPAELVLLDNAKTLGSSQTSQRGGPLRRSGGMGRSSGSSMRAGYAHPPTPNGEVDARLDELKRGDKQRRG